MKTLKNDSHQILVVSAIALALALALTGCAPETTHYSSEEQDPRVSNIHQELTVETVSGSSYNEQALLKSAGVKIKKESTVQAADFSIGSISLEAQLRPLSVNGLSLQASDIHSKDGQIYVGYSSVDTNGQIIKRGGVEQVKAYGCYSAISILLGSYCIQSVAKIEFPNTDIFGVFSDGTYLWATGSTSDESASPNYGRLYKVGLDSSDKITSLQGTAVLPSYAGTSVVSLGSTVLATSGTSTDASRMGGLNFINPSTMTVSSTQPLYDARAVGVYDQHDVKAYVSRGKDANSTGSIVEYNTNGTGGAQRTVNTGGNTIAESKSSIQVGNTLILSSAGEKGFSVICKNTGASLLTVNAVTVPGIPAAQTVTNSVLAIPGYILAANGEAGIYVYKFTKTHVANSNYCLGVTATLVGRLALSNESDAAVFLNSSLSANSLHYLPIVNLLNIVTAKLVVVASGNKGVSLINITNLSLLGSGLDVDDF